MREQKFTTYQVRRNSVYEFLKYVANIFSIWLPNLTIHYKIAPRPESQKDPGFILRKVLKQQKSLKQTSFTM